jgi:PleD family two-component response regulator/EAL domain-containing protein (putative c-di-GMP-specific phosphodiesterase class I)
MNVPSPAAGSDVGSQAGAERRDSALSALEACWLELASGWDVERARAFAVAIDELVESDGPLAERAADLSAYLSTFADGSLVPNRAQLIRLNVLAHALFTTQGSPAAPATSADAGPSVAPVTSLPAPPPRPAEARNTICLLDVPELLAPGLVESLTERGYQVRHFEQEQALEGFLDGARPGALLLNASHLRALPRLTRRLGDAAPGTPLGPALLVLSGARDLTHRLLAMRSGASAFFGAPLDSYRIVSRIEELLGRHQATPYRVLIVDADRDHAASCGRWLVEQGMTARLAFDGQSTLSAVSEFRPDIALIDFELPDVRGFELAQVLHQQPEFATLPIVLYATEADDAQRFDAIAAGADDVLVKPLKPRHLISVIRSRVQRAQWLRGQNAQVAGRDPRTGMYLRHSLIERLGGNLPSGSALLFVGVDRVEQVREAVGLGGLAQLESEIAQAFRESLATGDAATALRDFAYLVLSTREHRDQVTELAERLRLRIAERRAGGGDQALPLSVSVGITQLDDGESSVDARVARAEAAAMAAARVGGNRVLWYEPSDYSLVRPDPQLAVRAVLSRPWHEGNVRTEFRPIVPLAGKLGGQFDLLFSLVSTQEPGARAEYAQYAPIAHELGVLPAIERRRLEATLVTREARLKLGRQIRVFMPVSASTLLDTDLTEWLLSELRMRKLSGTGLTFELPSAELVDHREALAGPLQHLRQSGIRLGLSDYGRDWAAVHVLGSLSVDYLRLDPELVMHTTSDKAVSSTLLALVRKAHQLGAAVIAPEVESIDRAHVLLRLGIDYGVGDGLGRAAAEPEFDFNRPIW